MSVSLFSVRKSCVTIGRFTLPTAFQAARAPVVNDSRSAGPAQLLLSSDLSLRGPPRQFQGPEFLLRRSNDQADAQGRVAR